MGALSAQRIRSAANKRREQKSQREKERTRNTTENKNYSTSTRNYNYYSSNILQNVSKPQADLKDLPASEPAYDQNIRNYYSSNILQNVSKPQADFKDLPASEPAYDQNIRYEVEQIPNNNIIDSNTKKNETGQLKQCYQGPQSEFESGKYENSEKNVNSGKKKEKDNSCCIIY